MDKARQYMGLARKAGLLAVGEEQCGNAASGGKARLLLTAADASPNALKRASSFVNGRRALLRSLPWEKSELSSLLGRPGCSMVCFLDLSLASHFAAAMAESDESWKETAEKLTERSDKAARRKAAPRKHVK